MKLIAINGSPRKSMNTARLLEQVVAGAENQGAQAELVHLRDFTYRGCISCFHCKKPESEHYGRCALRDDLTSVLDKAHTADVIVLGSPFYFSAETSYMRAFMERFYFQYYLYTTKKQPLSPRKKATALLYTMNIKQDDLAVYNQTGPIAVAKGVMERLFAPCEVFLSCDTKQVNDYSKYEMDMWDVPAKLERNEKIFPQELEQAFAFGKRLVS